jgi:Flp pilus assembly protein TadD
MFVAFGHLRNGNVDEGRRTMTAAVEARPDEWRGHFNAACFEALAGDKDAAIAYLRRAIELEPAAREAAAKDKDFDAIRDDPEFPA